METKFKLAIAFMVFLFTTTHALAGETISLKVGYIQLSPSGEVAAEVNGQGTRVDLESDLALEDSKNVTAEAAVYLGDFRLAVGYLPLGFEGDTILTRDIEYNGTTYTAGSRVQSELNMDIVDVGLTWHFINMDDSPARFQLGLELAAKITDADVSISDGGTTESISETLPLPTIGLRGRVALGDFVGLVGRVGYLEYSGNHFLDGDVQVEFSPIPLVGVFAGYRLLDIAIDESDLYIDSEFSGFYGGLFVRF